MHWKDASVKYTICYCMDVNKQKIMDAINNGAKTLDDVRRMTGACTGGECAGKNPARRCCGKDIQEMLDFFVPFKEMLAGDEEQEQKAQ